jgi:signal transduction histidine kinase
MPVPGSVTPEPSGDELVARLVERVHGVAHDLNNALLAVRGYGEILRATLQSPQQQADVDEITSAADRATDLTRQLFALSASSRTVSGDTATGDVESLTKPFSADQLARPERGALDETADGAPVAGLRPVR